MNTKSIATIRSKANECLASKIKSQASLYDALPVLIELSEAVKAAKRIDGDDKELESQGLYRPAKNTWTAGEAVV